MSKIYGRLFLIVVFVAALDARQATADSGFAAAANLYELGQWRSAAQAFDRVAQDRLENRTTRLTARVYAGECLIQLGEYAEARERYQRVEQQGPPESLAAQVLFRLGETAWLAGDLAAGEALLKSFVKQYPRHASVSYAHTYLSKIDKRESTEEDFSALDEAVGRERDGRHDAALAAYHALIKRQSSGALRAEALRRAGRLHDRLDQHREALRFYRLFLAESPNSEKAAEVQLAVAWVHDRLEQTAQAAEQFRGVYAKFPQSAQAVEAAYWLALASADEKESEQSLQYVDWLLEQEPLLTDRPKLLGRALCLKCQLVTEAGNWEEVDALVERAAGRLDEGPLRSRLDFWAAEAALRLRRYDVARTRFAALQVQTIGLDERWVAMVPLRRAQLAARRQQWSEVLKILDQLEQDFPEFELDYEVDYLRGRALAGRGEMTTARRFYGRVLASELASGTESAVMAQWMVGETFFHQRDYARAREAYEKVMGQATLPEWQARGALQAGKCWELEQRWDEAANVYSTARKHYPASDSDKQLESRLRWAQSQTTQGRSAQQR